MSYYRQGPIRPGGAGIQIGVPPFTRMVKLLMIVHASVWLLQLIVGWIVGVGPGQYGPLTAWLGVRPDAVFSGAAWQPVTYMFLHSRLSPFHLIFNMLFLWMFGGDLERAWGGPAFLRFYLVCGVGAGIVTSIVGALMGPPDSLIPTIGASGAIYGLLIAFGVVFAERTVLFMLIFPMKARTLALILAGLAFFYSLTGPNDGTAHIAHLSGAVIGYLYLKRAWRVGDFYRELRWRYLRRKFKVVTRDDDDFDRWTH